MVEIILSNHFNVKSSHLCNVKAQRNVNGITIKINEIIFTVIC